MRLFIVLVKNVGIRKNFQRKIYSIILVVMELFKIIPKGYDMMKRQKKDVSHRVEVDEDMNDNLEDMIL